MADADDVRRLALARPALGIGPDEPLAAHPEVEAVAVDLFHPGQGQRRVIRSDIAVLFVGDEAEKQALLLGEPELFFTAAGYDGWPLVMLRLAEVDLRRLAELVTDAWRMRAPATLTGGTGGDAGR